LKVSQFLKSGMKNFVEERPEGYEILGSAKEGVHRVEIYIKKSQNRITDAKFNASKRCKKLLAVAELVTERLKNQEADKISINPDEILQFFAEEKEKEKMKNRLSIVLKALK